jgi:2-iminoacetate synthase
MRKPGLSQFSWRKETKMFSEFYPSADKEVRSILKNVKSPSEEKVKDILEKSKTESLDLPEIAELLETRGDQSFEMMRDFTLENFRGPEGNELRNISPIYLSSHCIDKCGYCQFSASRTDTQRTRLSLNQLEREVLSVIDEGNNVIEFTLATDPDFTPGKLAEYVNKTKKILGDRKGSGVLLCSDYLTEEDYKNLKEAGLWGIIQWDETLDRSKYEKWHGQSPRKKNFEERMDNHDRAAKSGLESATGVLFGLSDFRYDVLMQIAKARHLHNEYGKRPFVFGTPRLKPIGGKEMHPIDEVDDRKYETALMVYKIAEPDVARWLQTREMPELNFRNMLDGDVYTYRCGEVKPGGYQVNKSTVNSLKGGQFGVNEMERIDFEEKLKKTNFSVNYSWIGGD